MVLNLNKQRKSNWNYYLLNQLTAIVLLSTGTIFHFLTNGSTDFIWFIAAIVLLTWEEHFQRSTIAPLSYDIRHLEGRISELKRIAKSMKSKKKKNK